LQSPDAVNAIINTIGAFGSISGLECNVDKTNVMFIGPIDEETAVAVRNVGFAVSEGMTILGFEICNNVEATIEANITKMERKVDAQIRRWSPLRLSLIGRIAVSKTFLVSQLTFGGSIFEIPVENMARIQKKIDEYVLNGMPFAKDRLYLEPGAGGLGLLRVANLLTAIKTTWIRRIMQQGATDSWRYDIMKRCFFNLQCIRPYQFTQAGPIERIIIDNYWKVVVGWWGGGLAMFRILPFFTTPWLLGGEMKGGE